VGRALWGFVALAAVKPKKQEKVNLSFTFPLTPNSASASIRLPAAGRRRFLEN
jgi:DNA segregation ATPase FtsK/SpoIIIE-like protein